MTSRISTVLLACSLAFAVAGIAMSPPKKSSPEPPLSLPMQPQGKYAFISHPYASDDEANIAKRLPFTKIELQVWGPPDLFNLTAGQNSKTTLTNDGHAYYHGIQGVTRIGKFEGKVQLADYGRICLLLDRLGVEKENCELGIEVQVSQPVVGQLSVYLPGKQKPHVYRNDSNFGDYRFWLVQSIIERIIADIEWTAIKDE